MSNKFTLASGANAGDRIGGAVSACIQLSDGTDVFLIHDYQLGSSGNSFGLYYSSDHSTATLIANLAVNGFMQGFGGDLGAAMMLCRDNLNNIYCLGPTSPYYLSVQSFTKGAGYTWTTNAFATVPSAQMIGGSAVWCNTGGGTGGHGHILVAGGLTTGYPYYWILDAGAALAGTETVTASGQGPTFMGGSNFGILSGADLSADGFGATSGICCCVAGNGIPQWLQVGAWAVNSSGVLSTSTAINSPGSFVVQNQVSYGRIRCIRIAANTWAVVTLGSTISGRLGISRWSATVQLTAPVDSPVTTGWPTSIVGGHSWDALYDSTSGKVWAIAVDTATYTTINRLGCSVGSGVVWDIAVTVDDTAVGSGDDHLGAIRVVKEPIATLVGYQVHNVNASTYAAVGDYVGLASAPSAPTLTTPASGSYVDASGTVIFAATYNSTDGANQSFYALRRKIGAGAYGYWRASDSTWQAGVIWNPITTTPGSSFSISVTGLANGNVYNWSFASKEVFAGLAGSFATDFPFTSAAGPTVVVNAPSGTATVSQPLVTWTPTVTGSEINWQVILYTNAQYSAGGFVPGVGPNSYDSGVVASALTATLVGNALINQTVYRAYVRIAQTGGQLSPWAYSGFTDAIGPPAQPLLTGSYDSGNARSILNVQARDNLLSANAASIETDASAWAAQANCAIAQSSTFALDGSFSLKMTSTAAGTMAASAGTTGTGATPVLPNTQYTAIAKLRAGSVLRSCALTVFWYQSGGAPSGVRTQDTLQTANDAVGSWTFLGATVTSPSDAAFCLVYVQVTATGAANELHYIDNISLAPSTSGVWTRGGIVGASTVLLESSDDSGVTWKTVRGASALTVPTLTETVAPAYDYDIPPVATRQYRATIQAPVLGTSPVSATLSITSAIAHYWLKDPLNPAANLIVKVIGSQISSPRIDSVISERSTIYRPLGRTRAVVVADTITGREGSITFVANDAASAPALWAMLSLQRTLLLQNPFGEQWYIRVYGDRNISRPDLPPAADRQSFRVNYVEVDAP